MRSGRELSLVCCSALRGTSETETIGFYCLVMLPCLNLTHILSETHTHTHTRTTQAQADSSDHPALQEQRESDAAERKESEEGWVEQQLQR